VEVRRQVLFVFREEEDVTTEERYEARATANRYWTEDDYLFGRLDWRKDNFGGVREEWVPSVGYGRVILQNERHDLRGESAPATASRTWPTAAARKARRSAAGSRIVADLEAAEFYQNALVQWSDDNTCWRARPACGRTSSAT
jgi:putative salt-induced outer membrane protein